MTDETTDTTPPEPNTGVGGDQDELAKVRREAAGHRGRLREVEQERDRLAEQVTGYRRAEVEFHAAGVLAAPGDVWLDGDDVESLLDADGNVNPDAVRERADALIAERPGLAAPVEPEPMPTRPKSDLTNPMQDRDADPKSWADALDPRSA